MAIADWIRESTARHRAKLIEQGRAEGFELGFADAYAPAFRESYYQGYNDAVRDKARKRRRENTDHCPRSPIYAPRPQP